MQTGKIMITEEKEKTDERIEKWIDILKDELNL